MDLYDRGALAARNTAPEEITAEAVRLKEAALLDFGVGNSVIGSWLYTKCHHHIPTTAIGTAAVTATGDGVCSLLFNPDFFVAIGLDGVKFVLFHEARHLVQRHLHIAPELRDDPLFTLATEVTVNHVAMLRLGVSQLPSVPDGAVPDDPTGPPPAAGSDPRPGVTGSGPRTGVGAARRRPVGVDPREVHRAYHEDLAAQGLAPLEYDDFVETDLSVYQELKRMTHPPVPQALCLHLWLALHGAGPDDGVPLDDETVERIVGQVLAEVVRQARTGNRAARDEILQLADRCLDAGVRVEKLWGLLGLAALRGHTERTRRVDWWKRWLVDVLASRLRDGERLVYPRKLGAVLLALGHEPLLLRRGRQREKVVLVALDTSASMPDEVVRWLTTLVGQADGVRAHWVSFDATVLPFRPGERVLGGGGTDFQQVVDYAEGRLQVDGHRLEEQLDAVIMLTDGYAPAVRPAEPGRWIWLITDGGSTWPESADPPMACHLVTTGER